MTARRLKIMARYARGRILDIGYAQMPNPHLEGDVIGLDPAEAPCPPNYRNVVVGTLDDAPFGDDEFDTVVAGEVIEHVEEPLKFLRNCRRLLKPGGRLVLSTINPFFPPIVLLNWLMIPRFYFAPDHVFEIAPRFLVRFLRETGFRLVKMRSGGTPLPIGGGRCIALPTPRALSFHVIYLAEAE